MGVLPLGPPAEVPGVYMGPLWTFQPSPVSSE